MQTRTYKVYTYNGLSDDAKEHARADYEATLDYPWSDEALASLNAFCDHFGVKLADYQYSHSQYQGRGDHIRIELPWSLEALDELPSRSAIDNSDNGEAYEALRDDMEAMRKIIASDSWLTGYCMDVTLWEAFEKAIDLESLNIQEAFDDVGHAFMQAIRDDIAYLVSAEAFAESCEANEWLFSANGDME